MTTITEEATKVRETGWLIELKGSGPPHWFQLDHHDDNWTQDSLKALRFARKIDAEAYIEDVGWTEAFASEHEWSDASWLRAASAIAPQAEGRDTRLREASRELCECPKCGRSHWKLADNPPASIREG